MARGDNFINNLERTSSENFFKLEERVKADLWERAMEGDTRAIDTLLKFIEVGMKVVELSHYRNNLSAIAERLEGREQIGELFLILDRIATSLDHIEKKLGGTDSF
ncbi:MAG: hypothetical protein RDV48_02905 [Candidatus Eremiobacteraeota bacterium]|nr:hypothetical protein [Candidatus Eremiobacteraeota bacterium]